MKAWIEARGHGPVDVQPGGTGQFDVVIGEKFVYSRRKASYADTLRALEQQPRADHAGTMDGIIIHGATP